jgi:CspA family cold shock protein
MINCHSGPDGERSNTMRGTVKCFFPQRGFGFIRCENGTEVFVHHRQVWGTRRGLEKGENVEFELRCDARSITACNVRIIAAPKLPMGTSSVPVLRPPGLAQDTSTTLNISGAGGQTHVQPNRNGPHLLRIWHGFRAMMPRWLAKALP